MPTKIPFVVTDDGRGGRKAAVGETIDPAYISGGGGTGVTDGDKGDIVISGTGTVYTIDTNAVSTTKINDLAVTTAKINDLAVTSGKINTGAVVEAKIGSGAVVAAKIGTAAVTEDKIDTGAVTNAKLGSGAVTDAKVSSGIDAAKIGGGAVSNTEFSYLDGVTSAIQTQLNKRPRVVISRYDNQATTGTIAQTLYSNSLAADTLNAAGACIKGSYAGSASNTSNAKSIVLQFAGTTMHTGTLSSNQRDWVFDFVITRSDEFSIRYWVRFTQADGTGSLNYGTATGLDLPGTAYNLILQATTAVSGEVTAAMAEVTYRPVP